MANFKEVLLKAFDNTKTFTVATAKTTKEKMDVAKNKLELKREIKNAEKQIQSELLKAGKVAYDAYLEGKTGELTEIFDEVTALNTKIGTCMKELKALDETDEEIEVVKIETKEAPVEETTEEKPEEKTEE